MQVALVHDFLIQRGGAENVLKELTRIFPQSPIYTLVHHRGYSREVFGKHVYTSYIQQLPFADRKYQWYLPLMPSAIEHFNLSSYDIVVSSSSAFANGILTLPQTLHVCYCHTPTRYLWEDTHGYLADLRYPRVLKKLLIPLLSFLRVWDYQAAQRVDAFIANSKTVQKRIKKYYGRESTVMYPPVDVASFTVAAGPKDYFLAGGRLVPYKKIDLVIEAFRALDMPLKIFGTGPDTERLRKRAKDNVEFVGRVSEREKRKLFANARAFINPQVEDFGITMIEALASGTPVVAYRGGGAEEIVGDGINGVFFNEQTWEGIVDIVMRTDFSHFDPATVRASAEKFSTERFHREMRDFVERAYQMHPHA
ncbi:MAG: glycosyl transferase [Parcubacteria group bacterium CG11_big_fil_rev_8_21_14_0_20_48_46]|nr:MAG: hypothetical protein AUK21_02700 [Parcubacteria group bacterium CG2_30_48_51]PIW78892.1 MAG: glycosyltransferase family 4 protein [Parcubacteria group bacterium CG_4_8_14_3_um_filter_48_16]PIY77936.1 MAG: glycosyltransferase family 4 protein [Parcubacteria group bacterium CG_4_10_14_0_8_um_filter_48_154]PIZ78620.1 MAG: glycosyltransferase family 4 protein [bacterium CG_4_10_14_0_2_um_filter_48_144]PJC39602.1 MAG: glycosyltransferase family 4 protein [Parcubacteria group bacterium CG_4_9